MFTRLAVTHDQHHSIRLPGKDHAVCNGKNRRRIDHDVIVQLSTSLQDRVHRPRTQHLCRKRWNGAARQNLQIRNFGHSLYRFFQLRGSGQHRRQSDLAVQAEPVMNVRPPKVSVDQQNTRVPLRQNCRKIAGCRRLAFRWCRACQHNELRRTPGSPRSRSPNRSSWKHRDSFL